MKYLIKIAALFLFISIQFTSLAKENIPLTSQKTTATKNKLMKFAADCDPASAQADLDINNVRARILNGGDMWWDLSNARYEIPKVTDLNAVRKNSLFAGAIWIGGEDEGVLKLAAMTYRTNGSDFWPGPLDKVTGTTNKSRCEAYDKIYKVTRVEIENHVEAWQNGTLNSISEGIKNWPGNGNGANEPSQLAPFFDQDSNGIYEPQQGDYPVLQTECRGVPIHRENNRPSDQPDQMLWFVYNDRGNIHSETQGVAQGLELQTTAFAYATNDEINNMTFYTTRIINRGSSLSNTYFGQWVDPDLGNYTDDLIGCDVELNLGFCYNGDDNDEGILGYGLNPPSVGVDYFEGPKEIQIVDGVETEVELGMSKFVVYNNDFTNSGNPETPIHYYNYLRGKWKDGSCVMDNGSCVDYMNQDISNPGSPADKRFLQSTGPFSLKQGAVNKLTIGVVWARASSGGALGSLNLLKESSRKAQELFDNCFDLLDGPDAPVVEAQELDREVVIMFNDTKRIEAYEETTISDGKPATYKFQGYRIYQLKNSTIGSTDLDNIDLAREVLSCDKEDSISRLVNKPFDEILGEPYLKLMIDGSNQGLQHTFSIREDAFATGSNKRLVNHKPYYFLVLSYAGLPGHRDKEYLPGRRIQRLTIIPHQTAPEKGGIHVNGAYGDMPSIVRLEGQGNGAMDLELTDASSQEILLNGFMEFPQYKIGHGPINIKVVDPIKVPNGNFELTLLEDLSHKSIYDRFKGVDPSMTNWILVNTTTNDTIFSDYTIDYENEQVITNVQTQNALLDWGLSVTISQVVGPGNRALDNSNGLISWAVNWEDNSKQWMTAIPDIDNNAWYNWIRCGREGTSVASPDYSIHDYRDDQGSLIDPTEVYERIWDGRIAPYRLASKNIPSNATPQPARNYTLVQGVAYQGTQPPAHWSNLNNLASVDLVFTKDESLWTQCVVLEMGEEAGLNEGGAKKFEIRKHNSINKDGTENPNEQGRTWFPGYAINVETGERLNIILGEDSYQKSSNGSDLLWNPSDQGGSYSSGYAGFGGRHYIYIMDTDSSHLQALYPYGPKYDGGATYLKHVSGLVGDDYFRELNQRVLYHAMWAIPAYMAPGYQMDYNQNGMPVAPTGLSIKLRVKKPYRYFVTSNHKNQHNPRYAFSTNGIHVEKNITIGQNALNTIRTVPNPYFAYSAYENSPVENKVKITNLPEKCKISIHTLNGGLVRTIHKDDQSTESTWNLKNSAGVPIASGTYLIHVDAGPLGVKVVKWMGIMRELDLDSF